MEWRRRTEKEGRKEGGRKKEGGRRCSKKNKNPTQQCGEKGKKNRLSTSSISSRRSELDLMKLIE